MPSIHSNLTEGQQALVTENLPFLIFEHSMDVFYWKSESPDYEAQQTMLEMLKASLSDLGFNFTAHCDEETIWGVITCNMNQRVALDIL
jgi:hypothetical protein